MPWQILKIHPSPMQNAVTLVSTDAAATPTTDYHAADALARRTLGAASLAGKGYGLAGRPIRRYVSQAY